MYQNVEAASGAARLFLMVGARTLVTGAGDRGSWGQSNDCWG